jgi:acyl-CoA thioesterase FadM
MYTQTPIKARFYDCDMHDHVNNTVYLDYISQAMAEILPLPVLKTLNVDYASIDYRKPAKFNEELVVESWFLPKRVCLYRINAANGETLVQASITWQPYPALDEILDATPLTVESPFAMKTIKYDDKSRGLPFKSHIDVVNRSPVGIVGKISPSWYIDWCVESVCIGCEKRGWSVKKMVDTDFATFMTRHDIEVLSNPDWLESVTVLSRLRNFSKVRGTWGHEIIDNSTGSLLAKIFTTGAFVNMRGELAEPPIELLETCLLGEPD